MSSSEKMKQKRRDYKESFEGDGGQRVLRDLMMMFHMAKSTHVVSDSHESAFREGERHVILHILYMLGKRSDSEWFTDQFDQTVVDYHDITE